jgi:hypothetical protein
MSPCEHLLLDKLKLAATLCNRVQGLQAAVHEPSLQVSNNLVPYMVEGILPPS